MVRIPTYRRTLFLLGLLCCLQQSRVQPGLTDWTGQYFGRDTLTICLGITAICAGTYGLYRWFYTKNSVDSPAIPIFTSTPIASIPLAPKPSLEFLRSSVRQKVTREVRLFFAPFTAFNPNTPQGFIPVHTAVLKTILAMGQIMDTEKKSHDDPTLQYAYAAEKVSQLCQQYERLLRRYSLQEILGMPAEENLTVYRSYYALKNAIKSTIDEMRRLLNHEKRYEQSKALQQLYNHMSQALRSKFNELFAQRVMPSGPLWDSLMAAQGQALAHPEIGEELLARRFVGYDE